LVAAALSRAAAGRPLTRSAAVRRAGRAAAPHAGRRGFWRPRSHARPRAGPWRVRLLFVDAPSRIDLTMAPDCVLAIRHAALGARRRLTRAGGDWRRNVPDQPSV